MTVAMLLKKMGLPKGLAWRKLSVGGRDVDALVISQRLLLKATKAGEKWNGAEYPADQVKAYGEALKAEPSGPAYANQGSIFLGEHIDGTDTWVGTVDRDSLAWDADSLGWRGDYLIVDKPTQDKLLFQYAAGAVTWATSPRLDVDAESAKLGVAKAIRGKGLSLVLNPAQGSEAFLSAEKKSAEAGGPRREMRPVFIEAALREVMDTVPGLWSHEPGRVLNAVISLAATRKGLAREDMIRACMEAGADGAELANVLADGGAMCSPECMAACAKACGLDDAYLAGAMGVDPYCPEMAPMCEAEDGDEDLAQSLLAKDTPKTEVQTVIFDKGKFKNEGAAKAWAKEHGYTAAKVDKTEDSFRLRQKDPGDFKPGSLRTIDFKDGVKAVIGRLLSAATKEDSPMTEQEMKALADMIDGKIAAALAKVQPAAPAGPVTGERKLADLDSAFKAGSISREVYLSAVETLAKAPASPAPAAPVSSIPRPFRKALEAVRADSAKPEAVLFSDQALSEPEAIDECAAALVTLADGLKAAKGDGKACAALLSDHAAKLYYLTQDFANGADLASPGSVAAILAKAIPALASKAKEIEAALSAASKTVILGGGEPSKRKGVQAAPKDPKADGGRKVIDLASGTGEDKIVEPGGPIRDLMSGLDQFLTEEPAAAR